MAAPMNTDKDALVSLTKQVVNKLTSLQKVVQQLCCPHSPQIEEKAVDTQSNNLETPEL